MREIKFRGWHNTEKKMRQIDMIDFSDGTASSKEYNGWFDIEEESEIMQYTGLKDKNGVEIYEGDIIKTIYFRNEYIGKIVFNDNMACFEVYIKHADGHINSYLIGHMNTVEVIGNIYENPELLENN